MSVNVWPMWQVYAKKGGIALGVLVVLYGFFGMNIGYQSAFRHSQDVWNSAVMQEKLDLVGSEIRGLFKGSMQKAKKQEKKLANKNNRSRQSETISEDDRKSLDQLINNSAN